MRWVCWMAVVGLALAVAGPAAGQEVVLGNHGGHNPYCAPACGAPMYGLVPGCCEFPPNGCTDAWEGYCEERARSRAFWERLGQRSKAAAHGCRSCRGSTAVVTDRGCGPDCGGKAADAYYAPQPEKSTPAAAPSAASRAPSRPAPLTPAIGRRVGYRPPITPQH